jgi:hypothetical protein
MPAPAYPWKKGQNPDYTSFTIEVEVAVDQHGVMWSSHRLQDEQDVEIVEGLPNRGIERVADALLSEAIKREALLEVILKLSNFPEFKEKLSDPSPEAQQDLVNEVSSAMVAVISKAAAQIAPESAQAALNMVRQDLPSDE